MPAPNGNGLRPFEDPKFKERLKNLLLTLSENGIYSDDIILISGDVMNNMMRKESYTIIEIPKLNREVLETCFLQTARTSGMILLIIVAAFILNLTIGLTGVADAITKWVTSFGLSATAMLLALMLFYLVLGMFMDVLSMQVATIPITYPIIEALGVDPIWYGIYIVLMCELGMITPPVGMNLFVVHGIRPDKGGIQDAIWGALPYAVIMLLFTFLLIAAPWLATWLPGKMA